MDEVGRETHFLEEKETSDEEKEKGSTWDIKIKVKDILPGI